MSRSSFDGSRHTGFGHRIVRTQQIRDRHKVGSGVGVSKVQVQSRSWHRLGEQLDPPGQSTFCIFLLKQTSGDAFFLNSIVKVGRTQPAMIVYQDLIDPEIQG